MKIETRAVHSGDRKKLPDSVPVTTPINTATTYLYEKTEDLDKIFAREQAGFCYSRYDNPTNAALEELMASLEGGAGALACASGMAALEHALKAALLERPRRVLCARDIYGATIKLLLDVLGPFGIETSFVDANDLAAVTRALEEIRPGALLMETISNPLLRVGAIDEIARLCRGAGCALIVDNTFATPLLVRPLELGAHLVVHSTTKYLGGHGDTLGGLIVSDEEHLAAVRRLSRIAGPVMGPMEAFLTMRGVKTFALRMERQCQNARALAGWLRAHPRAAAVYHPDDPAHPDAAVIRRLLPEGLYGGMVSFEIAGLGRDGIFQFLDRLRMIVRATSLGDVHTMVLHPWISSHRDVPLPRKAEMGIRENLVRVSVGIEAIEDIIADLDQALAGV